MDIERGNINSVSVVRQYVLDTWRYWVGVSIGGVSIVGWFRIGEILPSTFFQILIVPILLPFALAFLFYFSLRKEKVALGILSFATAVLVFIAIVFVELTIHPPSEE